MQPRAKSWETSFGCETGPCFCCGHACPQTPHPSLLAFALQWLGVTSTNFDNLGLLVLLCTLSTLLPLPLLGLLPSTLDGNEEGEKKVG